MKDRPDFIKLLQAAAITANEAANPEEAYQKCLDQICLSFGWPVGHVYLVSDPAGNLFPSAIWHLDDPAAFDPLRSLTMTLRLSRGETLPGRVWESGAPAWVRDLSTLAQSPRMNAAAKLGLRAGLGVPVLVRDEVVAVLEFFSYADDAVEPAMLEVMRHVGTQLGRVVERKRAQDELAKTVSLLRATLESTADGILVVDSSGRIVSFNARFAQMWRIPSEILEARDDDRAIGFVLDQIKDPEAFLSKVRYLYARPSEESYDILEFKDGRVFERYSRPQEYEAAGTGRVWSFRDVTERMKVIAELRLSEERFRQMAENIHEVFYIAESDHSRIYYVSPVFEEIWGIPCGVLYENPAVWTERIHPEDSERFRSVIAEAARTGQYSLEYRVVRPDGATRWVWGRGYGIKDGGDSVRRVVGIIEDITRRKLDEEAIVNSEKRYRLLFDANPQPMFVVDEETLAFLAVNEAAVRHYGYSREEFLRMTIKDIRPPEDIPKVIEAAGLAVMPVLRPTQWRHRKKDGTILRVEITFDTLIFGGRRARVAHAHDITDRLKADERLRESESRLKIAQRIARLGSWEWNLPSGEVHWSDELFRIYGYEPAAFTPTTESFWKLVHPEDQGLLVSNLQAAVQTHQELIGEFRVIRPDGTIAHIRSSAEVISDGSGKPVRVRGTAQDITDWKRTEAALRESEERYALAVHGANDGVWDWNLKDNRAYFSPRFKSMLGYGPEDLSYDPFQWINLVHGEDRQRVELAFDSHIRGLTPHLEVEYKMKHKNGEYRWVLCRGAAIRDSQGKAIRMAGSQTDITDRKQVHEQLLHDAFHDSLTGLPNRALFMDRLDRALARLARGSEYRFATLFLDLDRFKNINDSLGHMTGDRLLIETARRLSQCVRPGDSVARLGGDEFSILLDDIGDPEEATEIAGRIIREISRVYQVGGQEVFTAASIGIALSAPRYTRPEEILRDADTAMYRAKTLGRGRYEIFDISMHASAVETLRLESDLRRAVERGEFALYYQPVIHLSSGRVAGFEALLRWTHPDRGIVLPAEFIPVAEETGLILPIGRWVLREAFRQGEAWRRSHASDPDRWMSVNISSKQFMQSTMMEEVADALRETGFPAANVKLEITESVLMHNAESATAMMLQLRALDLQVAIDDFGTGYSSLSYLHRFPIDLLKIDRSFISAMGRENKNAEIVRTVIALARSLGMEVTAEGIESEEQLAILKELGCTYGQGFFFSEAVPPKLAFAS